MPLIPIGFNARLFPNNWRPAREEIGFARANGFAAIQFRARNEGTGEDYLGDSFAAVAGMLAVLEMVILIGPDGRTATDQTQLDVLQANLPIIRALPCRHAHWHLAPSNPIDAGAARALEVTLIKQFRQAVAIAVDHGFQFATENNEPDERLFATPASCEAMLDEVPGLGLCGISTTPRRETRRGSRRWRRA
jgi:L-ribulose-5-phosphate 3-epimerase